MKTTYSIMLLGVMALGSACGPGIGEARIVMAPPREPNCQLEFLQIPMQNVMDPAGQWELIGTVSLGERGTVDPFSPRYRDIVRPRACSMGGSAVILWNSSTAQNGIGETSTGTVYGILRPRAAAGAPAAPQQF